MILYLNPNAAGASAILRPGETAQWRIIPHDRDVGGSWSGTAFALATQDDGAAWPLSFSDDPERPEAVVVALASSATAEMNHGAAYGVRAFVLDTTGTNNTCYLDAKVVISDAG